MKDHFSGHDIHCHTLSKNIFPYNLITYTATISTFALSSYPPSHKLFATLWNLRRCEQIITVHAAWMYSCTPLLPRLVAPSLGEERAPVYNCSTQKTLQTPCLRMEAHNSLQAFAVLCLCGLSLPI